VYDAGAPGGQPQMHAHPGTIYGVYKRANEGSASVYQADHGVASIGLRPHTVYGPARDQGLTSAPTQAMLAAVAGVRYRIPYGGVSQFQYAPDVARAFVQAALIPYDDASVHDLAGDLLDMSEVVAAIEHEVPEAAGLVTYDDVPLPFPGDVGGGTLASVTGPFEELSFAEGVTDTVGRFRALLAEGRVAAPTGG
jgi:UDP-glucuronate 4-epimerase